MTNGEMARAYAQQAEAILSEAEGLLRRGAWNLVVRRSQEVVELALKAVLRAIGIEVPHIHDVGVLLKDHQAKLPAAFRPEVDRWASVSRRLRREREVSFYGDEELGAPPQRLYTADDARAALADAGSVLAWCRDLLRELGV